MVTPHVKPDLSAQVEREIAAAQERMREALATKRTRLQRTKARVQHSLLVKP